MNEWLWLLSPTKEEEEGKVDSRDVKAIAIGTDFLDSLSLQVSKMKRKS
jgi:hypothetical protein